MNKKENLKFLYGIGDYNTCHFTSGSFLGTTTSPRPRVYADPAYDSTKAQQSVIHLDIRGWKYGILNAFPQFSKSIFRRDRYGQFRDMLEQRTDGKMYNTFTDDLGNIQGSINGPVQVKFINPSNNTTISPEYTYSSNLSFEATSSLPFFDGEVRNREEPINTSKIGTTTVVAI